MFGDFGHGIIMTIAAIYMIVKEKQLGSGRLNEMVSLDV
jgi:vacuolar-type H+-ATPase subunit I/STV1